MQFPYNIMLEVEFNAESLCMKIGAQGLKHPKGMCLETYNYRG